MRCLRRAGAAVQSGSAAARHTQRQRHALERGGGSQARLQQGCGRVLGGTCSSSAPAPAGPKRPRMASHWPRKYWKTSPNASRLAARTSARRSSISATGRALALRRPVTMSSSCCARAMRRLARVSCGAPNASPCAGLARAAVPQLDTRAAGYAGVHSGTHMRLKCMRHVAQLLTSSLTSHSGSRLCLPSTSPLARGDQPPAQGVQLPAAGRATRQARQASGAGRRALMYDRNHARRQAAAHAGRRAPRRAGGRVPGARW